MDIKLTLKEYRKKKGFTQKQIADKIGVHTTVISDYELGKLTPSLERAIELANIFDLTLDQFVKYDKTHTEYSDQLAKIMYTNNKEK